MVDPRKNLDLSEELEALVAVTQLKQLGGNKMLGKKYAQSFKHPFVRNLAKKLDSGSVHGVKDRDGLILKRLAGIKK